MLRQFTVGVRRTDERSPINDGRVSATSCPIASSPAPSPIRNHPCPIQRRTHWPWECTVQLSGIPSRLGHLDMPQPSNMTSHLPDCSCQQLRKLGLQRKLLVRRPPYKNFGPNGIERRSCEAVRGQFNPSIQPGAVSASSSTCLHYRLRAFTVPSNVQTSKCCTNCSLRPRLHSTHSDPF